MHLLKIPGLLFGPAVLAASLAACEPSPPLMTDAPPANVSACAATHHGLWLTGAADFALDATVSGPTCEKAVVLLVVRAPNGTPVLTWSSATADVFGLYDVTEPTAMKPALAEWLDQSRQMTSSQLPDWTAGDEMPGGEFLLHPEDWVDRDYYLSLRAEDAPILYFAQGHESAAVFILHNDMLESVGVWQFPG